MMKASHNLKKCVRELSSRLHDAQKDLRILSAVRWEPEFEAKFLEQAGAPKTGSLRFDYRPDQLRFKAEDKHEQFCALRDTIRFNAKHDLSEAPDVAEIFLNIVDDYENVLGLLLNRGSQPFGAYTKKLWGSPNHKILSDGTTIYEFVKRFKSNLDRISDEKTEKLFPKVLSAEAMVALLQQKLSEAHLREQVHVTISDKLVSDAAAGKNYLKIRKGAKFSIKDVNVFVYHEAFTHVATALNGMDQSHAKWLAFDSPRCTSTQEGLAVLMEMLSGHTYPARLRRIIDRILILGMIENGETPSQIYQMLRDDGYQHRDSLGLLMRAYRGSNPDFSQPFSKDVTYIKGLIECFNFIQMSLTDNHYDQIQALYAGKLTLLEVPAIVRGFKTGLIERPKWMPPPFLDLDALSGWFTYITALGGMSDRPMRDQFREKMRGPKGHSLPMHGAEKH